MRAGLCGIFLFAGLIGFANGDVLTATASGWGVRCQCGADGAVNGGEKCADVQCRFIWR